MDGRLVIIGPIRQEMLSGISKESQFEILKKHLSSFEDVPLTSGHFIKAAEFSNVCMKKGIQGSNTLKQECLYCGQVGFMPLRSQERIVGLNSCFNMHYLCIL